MSMNSKDDEQSLLGPGVVAAIVLILFWLLIHSNHVAHKEKLAASSRAHKLDIEWIEVRGELDRAKIQLKNCKW